MERQIKKMMLRRCKFHLFEFHSLSPTKRPNITLLFSCSSSDYKLKINKSAWHSFTDDVPSLAFFRWLKSYCFWRFEAVEMSTSFRLFGNDKLRFVEIQLMQLSSGEKSKTKSNQRQTYQRTHSASSDVSHFDFFHFFFLFIDFYRPNEFFVRKRRVRILSTSSFSKSLGNSVVKKKNVHDIRFISSLNVSIWKVITSLRLVSRENPNEWNDIRQIEWQKTMSAQCETEI